MQQIENRILYEDSYLGVTLGALIFSRGVILIDAPLRAEDARLWRSALLNQRGGSNRLLITLDAHPDRTLGARAMECTIITHQEAALSFRNRSTIFKGQGVESGAIWETFSDAIGIRWAFPDITFAQHVSLHWGGVEVILEHHPGPTPGSIWVNIPDTKVVFIGDTVVVNQPPFLAQADLGAWLESLDTLLKSYRNYSIISGRGGPITGEDIRAEKKILRSILKRMDRLAGKDALPDATRDMIPSLLKNYSIPLELRELYIKRFEHGLFHCFARRYHGGDLLGQPDTGGEDQ